MFVFGVTCPRWARASSFTWFLDHTQRRTTVGSTPLDEWSARCREPVGFEPTNSAVEWPQTYAVDSAATRIGKFANVGWIYSIAFAPFSLIIQTPYLRKQKVKCSIVQALRLCTGRTAHRGSRGIAVLYLDYGTRRRWGVSVTPRPLFNPGKTRYRLYRRLGWPQDRSGQVRKISPPPGFDPRTVQPVGSRYTDWATRPTYGYNVLYIKHLSAWPLPLHNKFRPVRYLTSYACRTSRKYLSKPDEMGVGTADVDLATGCETEESMFDSRQGKYTPSSRRGPYRFCKPTSILFNV